MDRQLKKLVVHQIHQIYPDVSSADIIVLYGSRASEQYVSDSDIDVLIFTNQYEYYKRVSVEKNFREPHQDAGFEIRLDNGLLLETKIYHMQNPTFDVLLYYDILHAQPLSAKDAFKRFQRSIQSEFEGQYEELLFRSYVHFFNEFKNLQGILKRDDALSKITLSMKKGIVLQALCRLLIVMEHKPYRFDKFLVHQASQTKHWKTVSTWVDQIAALDSVEGYTRLKTDVRDYINAQMPKRPYVPEWWKHLKRFKGG